MTEQQPQNAKRQSIASFILGPSVETNLPERIHRAVRARQEQGEVLIGWIQLSLVLVLGSLYALSPKMSAPDAIQMVPWALGLYLLFTLTRLVASYRCALPGWMLMISIVIDMALLMTLIWSFHIQYGQPPSFYLKAPTMLYVFIFIAIRALRFDPRYILMAGGAAIVGWLVLMLYVMFSDPNNPMITRNYVEYMTSNSILIGAEVDKILSIAIVTLVLAVAIHRGKLMMSQAAIDEVAARDLSRFVPPEVANQIVHAENAIQPGDGVSKEASVLFTDIEGFTTVSEQLSPQDLVSTLNDYFGVMHDIAQRHGGTVAQYHGDAILITFNTIIDDPNHASNAIRVACDIRDATTEQVFGNNIKLKTRCGVSTGEMTIGAIGAEDRLMFTVHGDEVNVAARLEQLNKEYGTYVLVSRQTRDAAGELFSYEQVGEVVVRGRSAPTQVFTV